MCCALNIARVTDASERERDTWTPDKLFNVVLKQNINISNISDATSLMLPAMLTTREGGATETILKPVVPGVFCGCGLWCQVCSVGVACGAGVLWVWPVVPGVFCGCGLWCRSSVGVVCGAGVFCRAGVLWVWPVVQGFCGCGLWCRSSVGVACGAGVLWVWPVVQEFCGCGLWCRSSVGVACA
ncbi:uncharacterized [Tachysurus ichikawai]